MEVLKENWLLFDILPIVWIVLIAFVWCLILRKKVLHKVEMKKIKYYFIWLAISLTISTILNTIAILILDSVVLQTILLTAWTINMAYDGIQLYILYTNVKMARMSEKLVEIIEKKVKEEEEKNNETFN